MYKVKIGSDGGKTCHVVISGLVEKSLSTPEPILLFEALGGKPTKLRIDGVQFAIQEKMGFNLWWIMDDQTVELIMPLESRGGFDFEKIIPLHSLDGAIGMAISSFKVTDPKMSFMIMLDMTKQ